MATEPPHRSWLAWLLDPMPPLAGPDVPRPRMLAWGLVCLVLSLQAIARYHWGFLAADRWLLVHLLGAYAVAFGVLAWLHGAAWLKRVRPDTWLVLVLGTLCLGAFWHTGRFDAWYRWFAEDVPSDAPLQSILPFIYFSLAGLLFRLAIPLLVLRTAVGWRPRDLGLRVPPGVYPPRIWPVYLGLYAVVLLPTLYAATTPAFLAKYPLARDLLGKDGGVDPVEFLVYQAFYVLVFVSGESFWRGILTFGTERDLGMYGVLLMLIPYVIAHFGKPLPETLGAMAAGTALGWLALKHRSVWLGVALHYAVALTMDLLALQGNGAWFRLE